MLLRELRGSIRRAGWKREGAGGVALIRDSQEVISVRVCWQFANLLQRKLPHNPAVLHNRNRPRVKITSPAPNFDQIKQINTTSGSVRRNGNRHETIRRYFVRGWMAGVHEQNIALI